MSSEASRRVVLFLDNTEDGVARSRFGKQLLRTLRRTGSHVVVARTADDVEGVDRFDAAVLSGSDVSLVPPLTRCARDRVRATRAVLRRAGHERPVLGVCFGMQALAHCLGGRVRPLGTSSRRGARLVRRAAANRQRFEALFATRRAAVWARHAHRDVVSRLPPRFSWIATDALSGTCAAMESADGMRAGVQFHPEAFPAHEALVRRFVARHASPKQSCSGSV